MRPRLKAIMAAMAEDMGFMAAMAEATGTMAATVALMGMVVLAMGAATIAVTATAEDTDITAIGGVTTGSPLQLD
ncbi:hypothetical protein MPPM_4098 [Methylorubrum populi]|uniref:Uncharacterized protein n=1 Tax=Methylorubrum populi TaxID=223967 RepID=A0A160PJI5_9HYPH|nr:hypothetical protein MPPM_4098 [Methylorubrum populi]